MARYIDIDDFRKNAYYADTDIDIGVYLAEHGCADVAPWAEVAKEIFEEIEKLHLHITNEFDLRRYEALKKKYTEDK